MRGENPGSPRGPPSRRATALVHPMRDSHARQSLRLRRHNERRVVITRLDVDTIRKDFPIFETGIAYLDSANTSQRPRQVLDAMREYFTRFNANIHRAPYRISEEATARYEETRDKVRRFLNAASRKEIVYTRGTTEAINLVAYSWGRQNVGAGDLIVLTVMEHHSNLVPWQLLAQEKGAPHMGIDVQAAGCDFNAFSGHKICGPTGAGILYGRRELLAAMPPFMGGGDMIKVVRLEGTTYADLPEKFEAGTQAIAEVIGLGAAIDYVEGIGSEAIRAHESELTDYAYEALTEIPGLHVFGPGPGADRAGVLSFDIDGIHPHDLATILDRRDVCIRAGHNCAMPLMTRLDVAATARASFYLYSTREEVDRLVDGLREAQRI